MSSEGRRAWSRRKWFRRPLGRSGHWFGAGTSQSLGDASSLNVDFSADLSSPPPRSLFSLNTGLSHTFMPHLHSFWILQCAGKFPFRCQWRTG